ncbi:hypothetical protein D3C76_389450 [compost metagenome]
MTFIDTLMRFLSGLGNFIGDAFNKLFSFLAVPLGWLISLIEGIWYFISKLFYVVIKVIDIFVALFQFIFALGAGFLRTIKGLLWIDFSQTPVNYPSATGTGINVVIERVLQPTGFMDVVPMILLAVVWLLFIVRIFALLGGEVNQDA